MGLDITAYSHITLLEILPDEQAWQQKYGDADGTPPLDGGQFGHLSQALDSALDSPYPS